jgi:hypothetical protein
MTLATALLIAAVVVSAMGATASLDQLMLVTGLRAAPILLSQRKFPPDDEPALALLFDRFARWHGLRTIIDVATLGVTIWALAATSAGGTLC